MAQQMNTILLLLVFIGLVGVMLVAFFTMEKVNDIATGKSPSKPRFNAADTLGGLSGKDLWDAMIGVPLRGITPKEILSLKPRYEVVLQKHLEILFEEGQHDGREGFPMPVRCERVVPTLRGEVESWIPHEYASGIYKVGYALITEPDEDHDTLREKLDEIGDELFYAAGLPPIPLSKLLMPFKEEEEMPPEMPETFPEPPAEEPAADARDMAEVVEDGGPVASLEARDPDAMAMAKNELTPADPASETVASEGDVLPATLSRSEKQAEAVPVS